MSRSNVGQVRRSQAISPFGVGAMVDLPYVSGIVLGLDYWKTRAEDEVNEPRLLQTIRRMYPTVERIMAPALLHEDSSGQQVETVGVPVAPFPRWMVCSACRLLARYDSGYFQSISNPYRPEEFKYVHKHCTKQPNIADKNKRPVIPARFLVACENGHLNDFPWREFVHGGPSDCNKELRLIEYGLVVEASDIEVTCACGAKQRMSKAFGTNSLLNIIRPKCDGHHPHHRLRSEVAADDCNEVPRTILLGASNSWFPITLSAISVPSAMSDLEQKLLENWPPFRAMVDVGNLEYVIRTGQFEWLSGLEPGPVWEAIGRVKKSTESEEIGSLKDPEWTVLSAATPTRHPWLRTAIATPPPGFDDVIEKVVLVERHREVRALVAFSRIDAPGDMSELDSLPAERRARLSRAAPSWVPGVELRGEGIFIQFREDALRSWEGRDDVKRRLGVLNSGHDLWCDRRPWLDPRPPGRPARYYLLHSLAHLLVREMSIRCGYSAASLRERLYASISHDGGGNMAGILIVTSTPDSEGTLGGLVGLGQPNELAPLLRLALERASLCSSDPHCSSHDPKHDAKLHGAACHSCQFLPETSCETGNRYLDRVLVVPTLNEPEVAFFREHHLE